MAKKPLASEPDLRDRRPEFVRAVALMPTSDGLWAMIAVDLTYGALEANVVKTMEPDARAGALDNCQQHLYDWSERFRENDL